MTSESHILVVDDDEDILVAAKFLLRRYFTNVETLSDPEKLHSLLQTHNFAAVLLDMNYGSGESSGRQGLHWLEQIVSASPETAVVTITAHAGIELAVNAIKKGATDFVIKPWQNEKLIATIHAAVKLHKAQRDFILNQNGVDQALNPEPYSTRNPLIGHSVPIKDVLSVIRKSAPTDVSVLITGENGTGKELVAREIHRQSNRHDKPFVSVDMGTLSESVIESELFGHKKGAFTDANENRKGIFQTADGGTIFLDEIGNLPIHLQSKLLTALEQGKVTPVGSNDLVSFDVRVIAATNLAHDSLYDPRVFRQDLLYRLNTIEICVPPLRERSEDIPEIAQHYITYYANKYNRGEMVMDNETVSQIVNHGWPGNVRALRHAVERAVVLAESNRLTPQDFFIVLNNRNKEVEQARNETKTKTNFNLEALEKNTIEQALAANNFNIRQTADALGITRPALYRRMEKYGVK